MQCCQSVQTAGSGGSIDDVLGQLGLLVSSGTSVGSNCSPISVAGVGGNSWQVMAATG